LTDYMDVTREFYNKNAMAYLKNTSEMLDIVWLEKFSARLLDGGSVLDVGCAGGRDSRWFIGRGYHVHGIDISDAMIEAALDSTPDGTFSVMDLRRLDFDDQSFDGVWCSCVLLHVSRDQASAAIAEMARVLRPGSPLYLLVKEGASAGVEEDQRYDGDQKFASYFEPNELRGFLEAASLDIVELHDSTSRVDEYRAKERIFVLAVRR